MDNKDLYLNGRSIIIVLAFITAILSFNVGCRNPFDFNPDDDDLQPPPDPPVLVEPANNKVYYYGITEPYPHDIHLVWSWVEGAESYQVEVSRDPEFTGATPVELEACSYDFSVSANGAYYWRARAYSTKWEWYTDWSTAWKFSTYYSPGF